VSRYATLPLGIDLGTSRTRVALMERREGGAPRLIAVAVRPTASEPTQAIVAALTELSTRERRCILGLGAPAAMFRAVEFPVLSRRERDRAARFEAARAIGSSIEGAVVRIIELDATRCVLAVAPKRVIAEHTAIVRAAGLRPVAIDDMAFALRRCVSPDAAVVDVGATLTTLVVSDEPVPLARAFATGGKALTEAVARGLGIDAGAAEHRKITIGLAGAGETARDELIAQLVAALTSARALARAAIRSVVLTGNGGRLAGFAAALEAALAMPVQPALLPDDLTPTLPADVVRAASPDWALACGLALWEAAA
jgi:Tfp pilus assembly PilM family ATPase